MPTNWTTHKGQQVLIADYSGIKQEAELMGVLYSTPTQLHQVPNNATILYVMDVTNTAISKRFAQISQRIEDEVFYCFRTQRAIVGLSAFAKLRFVILNLRKLKSTSFFNSRQEAIEYLTQKTYKYQIG